MQSVAAALSLAVVAIAGAFLLSLGAATLVARPRAEAFLQGFATTPARHYLELVIRATVGAAFIGASPQLPSSGVFFTAGLVLLGTTAVMALLPYRFHKAFAKRSVSNVLPYLPLIGFASILAGSALTWAAYAASVA